MESIAVSHVTAWTFQQHKSFWHVKNSNHIEMKVMSLYIHHMLGSIHHVLGSIQCSFYACCSPGAKDAFRVAAISSADIEQH